MQAATEHRRLVRGEGQYTDDIAAPDALHAVFVRSPHAHADFGAIDGASVAGMADVVAVFTGVDLEAAGLGSIRPLVRRSAADGSPMVLPPRLPLAVGTARFVGDPVALVVATTRTAAEDAAEVLAIDWRPHDSVTDTRRAVDPGAPRVWDEVADNVAYVWQSGDEAATAAQIAAAAHVTTLEIIVSRTTASPMEPRAALASYDAEREHFTLTAGIQAPWQTRAVLAKDVFGIAPDRLTVVTPQVGGSFGMKGQTFPEYGALLHAARQLGRTVRWLTSRSEGFASEDQGRDVAMTGSLALDAGGRILAVSMEGLTALGAYLSTRGTLTTVDNVPGILGPYHVPAAFARMRGVYTHTPSISPYRGAGRPEASLLIERLIDVAARETGRDPVELRLLNMLRPDELPRTTALGFAYDCGDFPALLNEALDLGDVTGFPARREASAAAGKLRGLGVASVIARAANGQFETARATLSTDGRIRLECGAVSQGQGHDLTFPALAAERLGIAVDGIDYVTGSSDQFAAAVGTFGSRSSGIGGSAVVEAADNLVAALRPEAARQLNAEPGAVTFAEGTFSAGAGRLSLAELGRRLAEPIAAEGRFAPESGTFPNGAHVCEVEIDRATGAVGVARYSVVEDVGTVLQPAIVKGQVHGGIVQGLAQAMAERIVYDDASGQLVTGSFMDFAVPRADDMPSFAVASHPVPTARNLVGAKGAGEGGTIGALPAFQNALADALAPFGVRDIPMPATPEALWRLITPPPTGTQ